MTKRETKTTREPEFEEVSDRSDLSSDFPKVLKAIGKRSCGIITAHRNYPDKKQRRALSDQRHGDGVFHIVREMEERNVHFNRIRQERLQEHINESYYTQITIDHLSNDILESSSLIWPLFARRGRDESLLRFLKDLSMKFGQNSFFFFPYQSTPLMYEYRSGLWTSESKFEISTLDDLERVLQELKWAAYRDLPGPDLSTISACEVIRVWGPRQPWTRIQHGGLFMAIAILHGMYLHRLKKMDFLSTIERERHISTPQYENLLNSVRLNRFNRFLINLKYRKRRDVHKDAEESS